MALEVWPAGVPYRPRKSDGPEDVITPVMLRTDMDGGNVRQRRRRSTTPRRINMPIRMTPAQRATFEAWYNDDIAQGADPFEMDIYTGSALVTYECMIVGGVIRWRPSGPRWMLSFDLDVVRPV